MTDIHTLQIRSYNMSRIKAKNTKPEIILRKQLFSRGYRYTLNNSKYPGNPDLILKKHNTAIFVHGCFWHGHSGCKYFVIPQTRREWWIDKIEGTRRRDKNARKELKALGWKVIEVWECEIKPRKLESRIEQLITEIKQYSL